METVLFGNKFTIPRGDIIEFIVTVKQIVLSNQYHIELMKDGDIVIDAGANMGIFSALAVFSHP